MKYLDFDRLLREQDPAPVRVRVFGRTHEIADRIPAVLVLELMQYDEGEPVPAPALIRAAGRLFGEAVVAGWMEEDRISLDALAELVQRTLRMLNGEEGDMEPVSEDCPESRPKN